MHTFLSNPQDAKILPNLGWAQESCQTGPVWLFLRLFYDEFKEIKKTL